MSWLRGGPRGKRCSKLRGGTPFPGADLWEGNLNLCMNVTVVLMTRIKEFCPSSDLVPLTQTSLGAAGPTAEPAYLLFHSRAGCRPAAGPPPRPRELGGRAGQGRAGVPAADP